MRLYKSTKEPIPSVEKWNEFLQNSNNLSYKNQLSGALSPGSRGRSVLSPPGSLPAQLVKPVSFSARVSPPSSGVLGAGSVRKPRAIDAGMPRYELALILKAMQRPETAAALKRTLEALRDRGAVARSLENLGERALPYKMSAHSQRHTRGG